MGKILVGLIGIFALGFLCFCAGVLHAKGSRDAILMIVLAATTLNPILSAFSRD